MSWKDALRGISAKGYRQTKNGRYETFISNHCKTISLGTYDTIDVAKEALFNYRVARLTNGVERYGLNIDDCVVYQNNYIVFRNGMIFNLHGEQMVGGINRGGYRHGIFNGHNRDHHKVIADCFIENPDELRDVNHKNGDKLDLDVNNLERTSHADNTKHSYDHGLQLTVGNRYGKFRVLNQDDLKFSKTLHLQGDLDREIANQLKCSRELVSKKIREMNIR